MLVILWLIPILAAGAAFFVYVRYRRDAIEQEFRAKFAGREVLHVDKNATFVARESDRHARISGRGYLVLTKSELYFSLLLTQKHVSVPTESIRHVGSAPQVGGKNPGQEMLKIEFTDRDGHHDSISLIVENLNDWIEALRVYESRAAAAAPEPDATPVPEQQHEPIT